MTCSVEQCDKPVRCKGFCKKHHTRWLRHGNPLTVRKGGTPVGSQNREANPNWRGSEVTYLGAHQRTRRMCGSASGYSCEFCGGQANDWAYTRLDPAERQEVVRGYLVSYSPDPQFYIPLCVTCHRNFDAPKKVAA